MKTAGAVPESMAQKDPKRIRGGKFLDEAGKKALEKERKQVREKKAAEYRNRILTRVVLLTVNIILICMTLTGKIDQPYGVCFVSALSLLLGNQWK